MSMRIKADVSYRLLILVVAIVVLALPVVAQEPEPAAEEQLPEASEAEQLLLSIHRQREEIDKWEELAEQAPGSDQRAIELELAEMKLIALSDVRRLAEVVVESEAAGETPAPLREPVESLLRELPPLIRQHAKDAGTKASVLRARRDEASPEELVDLEYEIAEEDERINRIARAYVDHIFAMESLGIDASEDRDWLSDNLRRRANFLSRRIQLARMKQARWQKQLASVPGDPSVINRLDAIGERVDSNVAGLRAAVGLMKELGLNSSRYSEYLVEVTGDISGILDTDVAFSLAHRAFKAGKDWIADNASSVMVKIVLFVLIILLFRLLARMARRLVVRSLASSKIKTSRLLEEMITSMVKRVVMIFGVLVALSQMGVSLGPVLAGLGVAGFVIGFALQDVLSNFASGLMILFYRPFDVDDLVEVGTVFGKVNRMTLVSTTILTLDHQTLVVPNSKIWGDVIKNVTAQETRRVDMTFGISYEDDIPKAEKVLGEIVAGHAMVLDDPEPVIRLHALGESSVDFIVRPWVKTDDYWEVYWDVTREVKMRFDREGISIPFPQRDVHLYPKEATA